MRPSDGRALKPLTTVETWSMTHVKHISSAIYGPSNGNGQQMARNGTGYADPQRLNCLVPNVI
ncbi:hypothetical protein N7527_010927 [Penicillium freii]|nr:hypothetical protein N7527_010927 [Penicillium freii]